MDDAHIFVAPEKAQEELVHVLKIIDDFYKLLGFSPTYNLATRPKEALGEEKQWNMAENALAGALKTCGISFGRAEGEGAFYGPKIEVHIRDSQDRDWQMGTAQLDLVMLPEKFKLAYIDEGGARQVPWVIHRAIFGSFERFIGMLLEHTAGALPVWLAPIQARILTISENHLTYGQEILATLKNAGIRAELDDGNETVGKKIREGKMQKIPYLLVVGDKEVAAHTVTVETLRGERGESTSPEAFQGELTEKIKIRSS
jgi:threonyl-tRNA synthetase